MPSNVKFKEVERMLNAGGYELARINGSHHVFAKPNRNPISVPVHKGEVKYGHVRNIKKILAQE